MLDTLLNTSIDFAQRHPYSLWIIAVGAAYFGLVAIIRAVRRRLSRSLLGTVSDEWPELDRLLLPVMARAGFVTCEALMNHVLVDHPSRTTRALLEAYGLSVQRAKVEIEEHVQEDGPPVTMEAMGIAVATCAHARWSRPSEQTIDRSAMLVPMFSIPEIADAGARNASFAAIDNRDVGLERPAPSYRSTLFNNLW